MISASTISFLFGAALGQRFHVLVLLPAMVIVVALSVGVGIERPQAWEIAKSAAIAALFLQSGYFAGLILRHFLSGAPQEPTPVPKS